MEYVLAGDVHMSDRPPSSCTADYGTDILDLLQQVIALAYQREAAGVVIAGDLFHCKAPSRTSHRTIMQLIKIFSGGPPIWVVPGNHDLQYDRQESVTDTQPLGVLLEAGAVMLLDGWAPNGKMIYGVPWQQKWDNLHVFDALQGYRDWRVHSGTPALVVAHAPLYPPGKELQYEFYPAAQWADAMCGGQCFYGHIHEPHGTWQLKDVTFCNNGALSRGSLHEYNITRQVGATLWDDETGRFTFVPLKARPASEVFRLEEKQQVTDMKGRLDEFLKAISATSLSEVSATSVLNYFRGQNLKETEIALIEELLEHVA